MSSRSSISKFHSRLSLFILGIFAFTALCASSQQGRLTGDAQTSTNRPNKNLGGSQSLEVIGGSDRVFVKFSLPENLPPGTIGAHVGKATLKLFVNTVNNPGALGAAGVTSAWSESTITNATAPTIGALVGSVNIDATQQNQWIALDVTSIVQGWIDNAGSNNGVVLFAAAGGPDVLFDSKESQTTSHQPQLEIVLNHAATADNATNAATAANATQLGGVPAGNFALKSDPVAAGSPNYIQNTTVQQPLSNFNISGNGTVGGTLTANTLSLNIVNANTQFNLGGQRFAAQVGSALTSSTFLGNGAGQNEMPFADGQGHGNIFIGDSAGKNNVAGSENSFVGFNAGFNNIGGSFNDFFGHNAGFSNNTGNSNAFFGGFAGLNLKDGSENTVLGIGAGSFGSTGNDNTFVGFSSGSPSTLRAVTNIGTNNTLLGANTTLAADALDHAAAIGADAVANASNTIVLGRSAGQDTVQVPGALSVNTFSANVLNAGSQFNLGGAHILSTAGFQNTFLGVSAGLKNSSSFNSFFGTLAGTENTTGLGNSFFGDTAGQKNTTGSHNSSFGSGAGFINDGASDNSMFGYHAGVVSTGAFNSFFGSSAGSSNTTGGANTFVGAGAGTSNTTGFNNNFFGQAAGAVNTTGSSNDFFGIRAGLLNSTGILNSFFGEETGLNNTQGQRNSFFGNSAGFTNTTGADNSALGAHADVASANLNFATAIGAGAVVSSSNTIVLGRSAGQDTVQIPGALSVNSFSANVLNAATQFNLANNPFISANGAGNLFIGLAAGAANVPVGTGNGTSNTFVGINAGSSNTSGAFNTFFGDHAGTSTTQGIANSFFGSFAGEKNTMGFQNAFFGGGSGESNSTGSGNSFFGELAGVANDVGTDNSYFGRLAGIDYTGNENAFFGARSGNQVTPSAGSRDTFLGSNSGQTNTSGSDNTIVGAHADVVSDNLNFATAIGAGAVVGSSNTIVLGRSAGQDTVQVPGALSVNTFSANILNAGSQFNLGGAHILSTAGFQNTFLGINAGVSNNSGQFNSFFGTLAGSDNTTGLGNAFFGDTAGQKNTTGSHNSSFGSGAGFINVTASDNSMYGYHAGVVSTGGLNSFFGSLAGSSNTTGNRNTFVGDAAGTSNTDGQDNNFFGAAAGGFNTIGARNSFFGLFAGFDNRTGADNTALGANADVASDNLNFATAIGAGAVVSSSNTIVLGRSGGQDTVQVPGALSVNTFSANILNAGSQFNLGGNRVIGFENAVNAENLYIGPGAGAASAPSQISGFKGAFQNTFLGISAGGDTTIGTLDTFVGFETGLNNTTEDANSYFGTWAGRNATGGSFNSFFGRSAGFSEAGDNNSYFGYVAGSGATGQRNSMFGSEAGERASSGDDNAFFGFGAGFHNNANHNAFFGSFAGTATSTGAENTFVGFQAGKTNLAGTSNTLLGSGADVAADGLTNATAIGAGAVVGQSNALILGNNVNVGIGTSTPGSRLTVAGLVESTTGGVKFPDGSIQTTAATGAAGPVVKSLNGLNNDIILAAGTSNVTITPSGNTLSISVAASSGGGGILNQTFLQTGANFNIDGTGTAGILNAQTQYNLGGGRVLSAPFQDNLFIGKGTGVNSNPSGDNIENVFAGTSSGTNTTECCNAFFGNFTGQNNTDGSGNTFLGYQAGKTNTHGGANTFVGENAGNLHTTGNANTFIGTLAGVFDSTGSNNTSIGAGSGGGVLTQPPNGSPGTFNTFLGANATASQQDFTYATAIGANAIVTASNTVVIGRPADTVSIPGTLTKAAGSFKIDDPIDPANKTLSHSFVESPDMMNVYNGNIVTDERGEAVVTMPEWFEALNRDFRYQLTVIGQFAQAIIAAEMKDNRFAIKTDKPNVKVSWQVTGIRHDAYANAHRIPVEEAKPATERGSYLFPAGFKGTTQ